MTPAIEKAIDDAVCALDDMKGGGLYYTHDERAAIEQRLRTLAEAVRRETLDSILAFVETQDSRPSIPTNKIPAIGDQGDDGEF